ncbi:MAG: AtpZ/AtpI family protein [Candidatus Goldiibacteriota bacterium]
MKEDEKQILRRAAELSSLGFTLVLTTFSGLGLGLLLDKWTKLKPLFTIIMLLAGIAAGFMYIIYKYGDHGKK